MKYKIKFGFQDAFEVEADSIESAEDKIIQFVRCELDRLRDSEDCCSFEVMGSGWKPENDSSAFRSGPLVEELKLI
jgi:hypothetical protein